MVDLAYFLFGPNCHDRSVYYEDNQETTFIRRYEDKAMQIYYQELTQANPTIKENYSFE